MVVLPGNCFFAVLAMDNLCCACCPGIKTMEALAVEEHAEEGTTAAFLCLLAAECLCAFRILCLAAPFVLPTMCSTCGHIGSTWIFKDQSR